MITTLLYSLFLLLPLTSQNRLRFVPTVCACTCVRIHVRASFQVDITNDSYGDDSHSDAATATSNHVMIVPSMEDLSVFPDHRFEVVYASHCLEHVGWQVRFKRSER